tara:strand:+ start:228 stop:452 length:225 start_codon:yes stop_codon:yes gene_type:complete
MKIGLLNITQKDLLVGVEYEPSTYYNPIQDCNDDWIISTQEIDQTTNPNFEWIKSITLIDYCEKVYPPVPPPSL